MARLSKIDKLPAELRETIGRLREAGHTIDQIHNHLKSMAVDVGRSAVGEHVKDIDQMAQLVRETRAVSEAMLKPLADEPENRVARACIEALQALLMKLIRRINAAGEDALDSKEFKLLSETVRNLTQAMRLNQSSLLELRRVFAAEAAAAVDTVAKSDGLSAETVGRLKSAFLGIKTGEGAGAPTPTPTPTQ